MQDVKALKRRVEVSFPDLSADDLEALFPQKVRFAGLWLKSMYFRGCMFRLSHAGGMHGWKVATQAALIPENYTDSL